MNIYLRCELLPISDMSLPFSVFAQYFEVEVRSKREATINWHPLAVEDAEISAPSQATLWISETELTWTLSGRPFSGRPSLARWSNFFRVGSIAMELVRNQVVASWHLWSEVWTLAVSLDPRFALARYPGPDSPDFMVIFGAGYHKHASVLAWEQENSLRLDVSLVGHPLLDKGRYGGSDDFLERLS